MGHQINRKAFKPTKADTNKDDSTTRAAPKTETTAQTAMKIAIVLNVAGFLNIILTCALGLSFGIGAFSCILGLAAACISLICRNKVLIVSSIVLTIGIFIAGYTVEYIDSLGAVKTTAVDSEIVAPRHMVPIDHTGTIYNLVRKDYTLYVYFSNADQSDADFLLALENVMDEAGLYGDPRLSEDNLYQLPGYSQIYYFDTKLMPASEVESVFTLLDLDANSIPCLVMVSYKAVVRSVSVADEQSIRDFVFGDESAATPLRAVVVEATRLTRT